jgi:hypothetical protein
VAVAVGAVLTVASGASATEPPALPVLVRSIGPKAIRVRIAAFTNGFVFPCSSTSNTELWEGPLEPGQQAGIRTPEGCVCVQHTYEDFPDINWSMGETACRPMVCIGWGRARYCWPSPDPTIRVTVSSTVPAGS